MLLMMVPTVREDVLNNSIIHNNCNTILKNHIKKKKLTQIDNQVLKNFKGFARIHCLVPGWLVSGFWWIWRREDKWRVICVAELCKLRQIKFTSFDPGKNGKRERERNGKKDDKGGEERRSPLTRRRHRKKKKMTEEGRKWEKKVFSFFF